MMINVNFGYNLEEQFFCRCGGNVNALLLVGSVHILWNTTSLRYNMVEIIMNGHRDK